MDPDANLQEQRTVAARMPYLLEEKNYDHLAEAAERLADLVEALDVWISKGGALPKAWKTRG